MLMSNQLLHEMQEKYPHMTLLELFIDYFNELGYDYEYGMIHHFTQDIPEFTIDVMEEHESMERMHIWFSIVSDEGDSMHIKEKRIFTSRILDEYEDDYDYTWDESMEESDDAIAYDNRKIVALLHVLSNEFYDRYIPNFTFKEKTILTEALKILKDRVIENFDDIEEWV